MKTRFRTSPRSYREAAWRAALGATYSRREFLALSLAGVAIAAEELSIPAGMLEYLEVEVPLFVQSGSPIKLLHLSDLHASAFVSLDYLARALDLALEKQPDLICVTGDFVTEKFEAFEPYARLLKRLPAIAPTFACLGNHDGGAWAKQHGGFETTAEVRRLLEQAGIVLLHNQAATSEIRGRQLRLIGVGDLWSGELRADAAFSTAKGERVAATVVLAHNPDGKDLLRGKPWDLLLAGHTHGGEVNFTFLGESFAPVLDKRYVRGLHRWEDRWLHVSKGLGSLYGIRVGCPGDATLVTLRTQTN